MHCKTCGTEKLPEDLFIENECCKCIYARKLSQTIIINKCEICDNELNKSKWKYCSKECSVIGSKKKRENYWINKIRKNKMLNSDPGYLNY